MFSQKTHGFQQIRSAQEGKGLLGFLVGLVLATIIIIAVLLMLNSNSKRDFKQEPTLNASPSSVPEPPAGQGSMAVPPSLTADEMQGSGVNTASSMGMQQRPASDIAAASERSRLAFNDDGKASAPAIAPNTTGTTAPNNQANNESVTNTAPSVTPSVPPAVIPTPAPTAPKNDLASSNNNSDNEPSRPTPPKRNTGNEIKGTTVFDQPARPVRKPTQSANNTPKTYRPVDESALVDAPKAVKPKPKAPTATAQKPAKTVDKAEKPATKPTTVAKPKDGAVKPTPEQILNSGSIEKAREVAKQKAAAEAALRQQSGVAKAPAKPKAEPKVAATPKASSTSSGGKVVLQAGSFASANAADAQRARLAMMGVQTKVVKAESNGKQVYRVQTQNLKGSDAGNVKARLEQNGVNVYERSAQ